MYMGMGIWPGRRRRFRRGMLKYVVLKLLEVDERHGYDLIRHFAERGWGRLGAGTLYPVLAMLEEQGYVEGRDQDGKRTYRITDLGRQRLREVADELHGELHGDDENEGGREANVALRDALQRLSGAVTQSAHHAKPESIERIRQTLDAARKEIYTILANE